MPAVTLTQNRKLFSRPGMPTARRAETLFDFT